MERAAGQGRRLDEGLRALETYPDSDAVAPELAVKRVSPDEVEIIYPSARKMCALARGLAKGVANDYAEKVTVEEHRCMHKSARDCRIVVKLV